jgi:hypothetical protein
MDKSVRVYHSLDEMKADEYRYWQSRPGVGAVDAVEEMIEVAYALKGWKLDDRMDKSVVHIFRRPDRGLHNGES